MTTEAQRARIEELIREHTERVTADRQTARESLIREGVYNQAGQLSEDYGGSHEPSAGRPRGR